MGRVMVGLDGSEHGEHALAWAVAHARATGADLDVVTVVVPPMVGDPMVGVWALDHTHADRLETAQREAVEEALSSAGVQELVVTRSRPEGSPARTLLERAEGAALLVIGTHGHGTLKAAFLGSVTHQLATHAPCPVVAVPHDERELQRIVVGVDGSADAEQALRWASGIARERGATMEVIGVFDAHGAPVGAPWLPTLAVTDEQQMRDGLRSAIDQSITRVGIGDLDAEVHVLEGAAAQILKQRGEHADLLVVGSRGRGGFRGLLLGSASHAVLTHPPCPVAVVPMSA